MRKYLPSLVVVALILIDDFLRLLPDTMLSEPVGIFLIPLYIVKLLVDQLLAKILVFIMKLFDSYYGHPNLYHNTGLFGYELTFYGFLISSLIVLVVVITLNFIFIHRESGNKKLSKEKSLES